MIEELEKSTCSRCYRPLTADKSVVWFLIKFFFSISIPQRKKSPSDGQSRVSDIQKKTSRSNTRSEIGVQWFLGMPIRRDDIRGRRTLHCFREIMRNKKGEKTHSLPARESFCILLSCPTTDSRRKTGSTRAPVARPCTRAPVARPCTRARGKSYSPTVHCQKSRKKNGNHNGVINNNSNRS